jgi:hypothetical protein
MKSIFESAKTILEGTDPNQTQLDALTKVMLSMKAGYSEINATRGEFKKSIMLRELLLEIVSTIAGNTSLFNAFVAEYKKSVGIIEDTQIDESPEGIQKAKEEIELAEAIPADQVTYFNLVRSIKKTGVSNSSNTKFVAGSYALALEKKDGFFSSISKVDEKRNILWVVSLEPVKELNNAPKLVFKGITRDAFIKLKNTNLNEDTELFEDKLLNDIKSLKKIGWKLNKVIPFMITKGDDYDVKMTSDLITMYYNDGGVKKAPKMAPVKVPKPKKVSWPKDPPKNKVDDAGHAEAYLGQAVDSGESPDIYGMEAYQLLITAGYTERAAMAVMKNMGWDDDVNRSKNRTSKFAKKTAPKFRK